MVSRRRSSCVWYEIVALIIDEEVKLIIASQPSHAANQFITSYYALRTPTTCAQFIFLGVIHEAIQYCGSSPQTAGVGGESILEGRD